jgi:hypothetical protein
VKKYRLTKWNIVCQPKDQGGLGITNLAVKNICLLSKWFYRLLNEDGVWQQLQNKYFGGKSLTQVQGKPGDSHFRSDLIKVKNDLFKWGSFRLKDGCQIRFWKDTWLNNIPLCE